MEASNMKAMREALLCILDIAERDMPNYCRSRARDQGETESIRAWSNTIVELAKNALSKPARQCDIGTIDEQYQRYHALGEVYHTLTLANVLEWAQKPYKAPVEEEPKNEEPEEPETPPRLDICPKCGKDAARFIHPTFDGGSYVSCRECHYAPQTETWAPTDAKAAIRWNNLKR